MHHHLQVRSTAVFSITHALHQGLLMHIKQGAVANLAESPPEICHVCRLVWILLASICGGMPQNLCCSLLLQSDYVCSEIY